MPPRPSHPVRPAPLRASIHAPIHARVVLTAAATLLASAPAVARAQAPVPSPAPATAPPPAAPAAPNGGRPALGARFLPALGAAPPRIDGRLDDAAWRGAPVGGGFTQREPRAGQPASQRTEVRVAYDRVALYVAVRAWDPEPARIGRQLARRDPDGIYSDWIHVGIDSYRDRRTGFRFSLNPRGVQGDGFLYNDGDEDELWDAVWTGASHVDADGWSAEFRIPLSQLRYARGDAAGGATALPPGSWGFNVVREVARLGEESWWAPTPPDQPGVVSRFGTLTGMDSLAEASALELIPYVRSQVTQAPVPAGDPLARRTDPQAAVGLDLRRRLPRNLTLSATVNPDFGQAEVDPAVVNLTQFEVFFPERRPFFLEGADVFRFGKTTTFNDDDPPTFFYSRRIGRAPSRRIGEGSVVAPGGAPVAFVQAPSQTGILGAAKVSGKTPGGWSVGLLAAATRDERARTVDTTGAFGRAPVEPAGGYGIARLRRDFRDGNTVIGGVGTLATRRATGPFASILPSASSVVGVDAEHAWHARTWTVSGVLAGSRVQGDRAVIARLQRAAPRVFQRPDAQGLGVDTTRTALGGHFGALTVAKTGGEHWVGSATYEETSPGFEVNDLGFQQRADLRSLSGALQYRQRRQGTRGVARAFRNWEAGLYHTSSRNFDGDGLATRTALYAEAELASFWETSLFVSHRAPALDDRLLRGGPLARRPERLNGEFGVRTDSRRRVIGGLSLGAGEDAVGLWERGVSLSLDLRPASAVRVRLEPGWQRSREIDQFVTSAADPTAAATFGRRYVFGRIAREEVNLTTRVDWTFTPRLSFQLFAQPFAATGRYAGFASFDRPGAYAFTPLDATRGGGRVALDADGAGPSPTIVVDEPDFALRSLRGSAVVRWEYRPGSALFVVWQQQRAVSRDPALGPLLPGERPEVQRVFGDPGTHVLLVKLSHWLGR